MTSTSVLRLRRFVAEHGPVVAALLVVVGAAAIGAGAWIYTHPETTQVTDLAHEQTVRTSLETTANATGQTGLYWPGERLHNKPVYLQQAAPEVTLVLRTGVASSTDVRVEQRLVLVTSANRDDEVFWSENRTLARTRATGETVVSRVTLNVADLKDRLAEREQAVGNAGDLATHIRFRVRYDTGRYAGTITKRLPVDIGDDWYSIPTSSVTRDRNTEVVRTATVPRSSTTYLAPIGVGVLALLAGVAVAGAWRTGLRSTDEDLTRWIRHHTHADWISEGSLASVDAERPIPVDSIEELVDVAIDADRRVVYDPDIDVYAVVDDAAVYYYLADESPEWTPLDRGA